MQTTIIVSALILNYATTPVNKWSLNPSIMRMNMNTTLRKVFEYDFGVLFIFANNVCSPTPPSPFIVTTRTEQSHTHCPLFECKKSSFRPPTTSSLKYNQVARFSAFDWVDFDGDPVFQLLHNHTRTLRVHQIR